MRVVRNLVRVKGGVDLGEPATQASRRTILLLKVISHRYERGSGLITSNESISMWPEMLALDEISASAILDRFLHHCHVVSIDGKSFRLKEMEAKVTNR